MIVVIVVGRMEEMDWDGRWMEESLWWWDLIRIVSWESLAFFVTFHHLFCELFFGRCGVDDDDDDDDDADADAAAVAGGGNEGETETG